MKSLLNKIRNTFAGIGNLLHYVGIGIWVAIKWTTRILRSVIVLGLIMTVFIISIYLESNSQDKIENWFALTALFFVLTSLIWVIYLLASASETNKIHPLKDIDPVENLWFWILVIGLYITFVAFLAEEGLKLKSEGLPIVMTFWQKQSITVFSVVMASMLADFVITMLRRMTKFHGSIVTAREEMSDAQKEISLASNNIISGEKELHNLLLSLGKMKLDILTWEGALGKEKKLKEKLHPENDPILPTYNTHIASLLDRVSSTYLKYVDGDRRQSYVQTLFATTFINGSLTQLTPPVDGKGPNFIQGNYGILSNMVEMLYAKCDDIYESCSSYYAGSEFTLDKVVYFTTLTMPLASYLNPIIFSGQSMSIVKAWDNARKRTRKGICDRDGEFHAGHMWKFYVESDKYEFKRCCLWLDDLTPLTNDKDNARDAILRFSEWKKRSFENEFSNLNAHTYDVYSSLPKLKQWLDENKISFSPSESREKFSHPRYLDQTIDDCLGYLTQGKKSSHTILETFLELYHPTKSCCTYYTLNYSKVKNIIKTNRTLMENAFADDEIWKKFINQVCSDQNNEFEPIGQDESNGHDGFYWHEIFFNRHIPVDIFAIGVRLKAKDGSSAIDWKGCIGGYVGGDFNNMYLSWHDEKISGPSWEIIKLFIEELYSSDELSTNAEIMAYYDTRENHDHE
jgi:hypothetical protein